MRVWSRMASMSELRQRLRVRRKCREEVATYDTGERFRMSIRYKDGTLYDRNLENSSAGRC